MLLDDLLTLWKRGSKYNRNEMKRTLQDLPSIVGAYSPMLLEEVTCRDMVLLHPVGDKDREPRTAPEAMMLDGLSFPLSLASFSDPALGHCFEQNPKHGTFEIL